MIWLVVAYLTYATAVPEGVRKKRFPIKSDEKMPKISGRLILLRGSESGSAALP
jgi:hypothetical protein